MAISTAATTTASPDFPRMVATAIAPASLTTQPRSGSVASGSPGLVKSSGSATSRKGSAMSARPRRSSGGSFAAAITAATGSSNSPSVAKSPSGVIVMTTT